MTIADLAKQFSGFEQFWTLEVFQRGRKPLQEIELETFAMIKHFWSKSRQLDMPYSPAWKIMHGMLKSYT